MTEVGFVHVNKFGIKKSCNNLEEAKTRVEKLGGRVEVTYTKIPEETKSFGLGQRGVSRSQYEKEKNHD